uniref:RoaA n=1 Tax=Euglena viridis TaxID=3040 RepID=M1EWD6_EUGVI|nr:RoaA [Euglena viridis]AEY70809.3 RoaA [Euglena viridis]
MTFFETKVLNIQNDIFIASKNINFRLIRFHQRLLTSSLVGRLLSVRNAIEKDNFNFLSSRDKLCIVLNLKYNRFLDKETKFYFLKNSGLSFFYKNFSLYDTSFQALTSLTCLPFIEFTSDRTIYGFRPYRDCSDLLFSIKSFFLKIIKKIFGVVLESFFFNNKLDSQLKMIRIFDNIYVFSNFPNKFQHYKLILIKFFNIRGIKLSEKSFLIYSFYEGFEFLGWKLQKSSFSFLLSQVSKNNIKSYKLDLKAIVKNSINVNLSKTLRILNFKIDEWINCYSLSDFWNNIANDLDLYLYKLLWKFFKRCHPRRSNSWIYHKYWKNLSGSWKLIAYDPLNGGISLLKSHNRFMDFHFAFPLMLNTFDKRNHKKISITLYEKYKKNFYSFYYLIYKRQKGLCFCCRRSLGFSNLKLVNLSRFTIKKRLNLVSNLHFFHSYCNWSY